MSSKFEERIDLDEEGTVVKIPTAIGEYFKGLQALAQSTR